MDNLEQFLKQVKEGKASFQEFINLIKVGDKEFKEFSDSVKNTNTNIGAYVDTLSESEQEIIKNAENLEQLKSELNEFTEATKKAAEAQLKLGEAFDKGSAAFDQFAGKIGFANATTLEGLVKSFKEAREKGLGVADSLLTVSSEAAGLATAFVSPTRLFFSFIGNSISLIGKIDSIRAGFVKLGPEFENFTKLATEGRQAILAYGGDLELLSKAYTTLGTSFSNFTLLTESQQTSLAELEVGLNNLGSSGVAFVDRFMVGFNMTTSEAISETMKLVAASESLGISIQQLERDFSAVIGPLAMYGDRATEVFIEIEALSKATGIAAAELVGFSRALENIDQASSAAARVNALFGEAVLNVQDLVTADVPERLRLIREGVLGSIGSFENLANIDPTGGLTRSLANALTGGNIEALQRLLSETGAATEDLTQSALQASLTQEEFAERSRRSQTAMERLQRSIQSLAVAFAPLMEFITNLTDGLTYLVVRFTEGKEAASVFSDEVRKTGNTLGVILAGGFLTRLVIGIVRFATASRTAAAAAPAAGAGLRSMAAGVSAFASPQAAAGLAVLVGIPALIAGIAAAMASRSFRNAAEMIGNFVELLTLLAGTGLSTLINRVVVIEDLTSAIRNLGKAIREEFDFSSQQAENFRASMLGIKELAEATEILNENSGQIATINAIRAAGNTVSNFEGGGNSNINVAVYLDSEDISSRVVRRVTNDIGRSVGTY